MLLRRDRGGLDRATRSGRQKRGRALGIRRGNRQSVRELPFEVLVPERSAGERNRKGEGSREGHEKEVARLKVEIARSGLIC